MSGVSCVWYACSSWFVFAFKFVVIHVCSPLPSLCLFVINFLCLRSGKPAAIANKPWGSPGRRRQRAESALIASMNRDAAPVDRQPKNCRICTRCCTEEDPCSRGFKVRWNYAKQARIDPISGLEVVSGKEDHYCVKVLHALAYSLFSTCVGLSVCRDAMYHVCSVSSARVCVCMCVFRPLFKAHETHPVYKHITAKVLAQKYADNEDGFRDQFEVARFVYQW